MVNWFNKKSEDKFVHPMMSHSMERYLEDMAKENEKLHETIIGSNKPELKGLFPKPDLNTVTEFENKIAEFFGAPYAVAVDSCTHGLELCLRYTGANKIQPPTNTYLSVPMLAKKMNLNLNWIKDWRWNKFYELANTNNKTVVDAATFWQRDGYFRFPNFEIFMCLSFQYQKHLSLGRGGMILCPDEQSYNQLKKMSYDGRLPGIPWRDQNIDTMGYHYYMTPETAQLGLDKLQAAIDTPAKIWDYSMYPDLTQMKIFNK